MVRRGLLWFALIGLVAASIMGCTSQSASPTAPAGNATIVVQRTPVAASSGAKGIAASSDSWSTVEMHLEGFSLSLPPNWLPLATDEASLAASVELAMKKDPKQAENVKTQAQNLMANGAKLIAFDLTPANSQSGFTTVVNVVKQTSANPISLDNYITASVANLEKTSGVAKPLTHRRISLPAGDAEELRYKVSSQKPDASPITLSYLQHVIVKDKTVFIVTYACSADQADKYPNTFNKIAQSFKLVQQ